MKGVLLKKLYSQGFLLMLIATLILLAITFVSIIITGNISVYYVAAATVCLLGFEFDLDRQTKDAYFLSAFPISVADHIKVSYLFDAVIGVFAIVVCSIGYALHHIQSINATIIHGGIYAVLALCPALLTVVAIKALCRFVFNIRSTGFVYLGIIFIIPLFQFVDKTVNKTELIAVLSVILLILNVIISRSALKRFRFERM